MRHVWSSHKLPVYCFIGTEKVHAEHTAQAGSQRYAQADKESLLSKTITRIVRRLQAVGRSKVKVK